MKILHVIPVFNPPELYGGSQQIVWQVSKELIKKGHEVHIYTSDVKRSDLSKRTEKTKEKIEGINIVRFQNISSFLAEKLRFIITPDMKQALERSVHNFDIIHVHEARSYQHICVYQVLKKRNIPYVIQVHGSLRDNKSIARRVYDLIFNKEILHSASNVIAISPAEIEQYKSFSVNEDKIALIPNGIELSQYRSLPQKGEFYKKFKIEKNKKIFLYIGRIHRSKGIDFLIKGYKSFLSQSQPQDTILVIAGLDDGYLKKAISLSKSLDISEKILFPGYLTETEKIEAYVDSSMIFCLEQNNVYLLVPLEAAVCKSPVVVADTNYISNVVEVGEFGYSVKYGDNIQIKNIMMDIYDDKKLIELGSNGRSFLFKNYGWDSIIGLLEKIYKKSIEDVSK